MVPISGEAPTETETERDVRVHKEAVGRMSNALEILSKSVIGGGLAKKLGRNNLEDVPVLGLVFDSLSSPVEVSGFRGSSKSIRHSIHLIVPNKDDDAPLAVGRTSEGFRTYPVKKEDEGKPDSIEWGVAGSSVSYRDVDLAKVFLDVKSASGESPRVNSVVWLGEYFETTYGNLSASMGSLLDDPADIDAFTHGFMAAHFDPDSINKTPSSSPA